MGDYEIGSSPNVTRPRRVAIVTHDLHPYGAQRVTAALAESMVERFSTACEVVSLGGGPLAIPVRKSAPVHVLGHSWKLPSRDMAPVAYALQQRGYEHVILNTVISGAFAPQFRALKFRVVGLVHEMPGLISSENLVGRLRSMHDGADHVVYPHESVRMAIGAAFPDLPARAAVDCFPQGLIRRNPWRGRQAEARKRLREVLRLPPGIPVVLGVGTADLRKGFDIFVRCARHVNVSLEVDCCFVWIGPMDDGLRPQLIAQGAITDPLPPYLALPGFVEETALYHAGADLFLLTSRQDPFPNVVLESMDAGVPIIAFSQSGGGAHLAQSVAGRVVDQPSAESFADAVVALLADSSARTAYGNASQQEIESHFTFERYTKRLLDLLGANGTAGLG